MLIPPSGLLSANSIIPQASPACTSAFSIFCPNVGLIAQSPLAAEAEAEAVESIEIEEWGCGATDLLAGIGNAQRATAMLRAPDIAKDYADNSTFSPAREPTRGGLPSSFGMSPTATVSVRTESLGKLTIAVQSPLFGPITIALEKTSLTTLVTFSPGNREKASEVLQLLPQLAASFSDVNVELPSGNTNSVPNFVRSTTEQSSKLGKAVETIKTPQRLRIGFRRAPEVEVEQVFP